MNDRNYLRLIAAMIADIHETVGADANGLNSKMVKSAIWSQHEWALTWEYGHLFEREEPDPKVDYVADVLKMWDIIEASYEQLDDGQMESVQERLRYGGKTPQFPGFDANNEDEYGIAGTIIDTLGRFERFRGRGVNSHGPTERRYRAQLDAMESYYERCRNSQYSLMTEDELVSVLNAPYAGTD